MGGGHIEFTGREGCNVGLKEGGERFRDEERERERKRKKTFSRRKSASCSELVTPFFLNCSSYESKEGIK